MDRAIAMQRCGDEERRTSVCRDFGAAMEGCCVSYWRASSAGYICRT